MERTGNWRGRQGQYIHIFFQPFYFFFMGNPKPLFFVNNQKAQILKFYILGQHPMGANHHIYQAFFQIVYGFLHFRAGTEPGQQIHTYRKVLHPLQKRVVMLLGQNRSRHQINHLLTFLYCLKRRPQSDLCLPIAHIPTNQPVHNPPAFHIPLCGFYGVQLILGFFVREQLLKFFLPYRVRPIRETVGRMPGRI